MSENYIYILDYEFIKKFVLSDKKCKEKLFNYLPIICNIDIDINKIIDSQLLIYLKSNSHKSGFYGYYDIIELVINQDIYNKLIKYFNLCELPNLYFIKYKEIFKFNKIISLNNYKLLCKKNNEVFTKFNFKIDKYNIYTYPINKVIKLLEEQIDEEITEDIITEDINNIETEDVIELEKSIIMDIPIMWIPCNILLDKINNNVISKKIIIEHYNKCHNCEITDNNKIVLEFNKKINFQIIKSILINNIIDSYQLTQKYIENEDIYTKLDLIEDNINIILYKYNNELYDNCLLVIKK